jgi:transglutaminase-like putative cysteine protease
MRDSLIVAALRGAIGRPRPATLADSVRRLTAWVARQVVTDPEAGSGSALGALRTRKGSPDAKARLLVTLARAAGIPARVANGLAIDSSAALAHSWAELWIEGWHAADPTYGHYPASTSLVRITTDRRSRPLELFPLVASARFLPIPPGP